MITVSARSHLCVKTIDPESSVAAQEMASSPLKLGFIAGAISRERIPLFEVSIKTNISLFQVWCISKLIEKLKSTYAELNDKSVEHTIVFHGEWRIESDVHQLICSCYLINEISWKKHIWKFIQTAKTIKFYMK